MMTKIDFSNYDKITDTMLYLGSKVNLNFTVKLCKQHNNTRYPMHKEYLVNNNYINSGSLISVKRSFDYYMELLYKDKESYFSYKIVPENILYILDQFNKAASWFRTEGLFGVVNNNLTLLGGIEPIKFIFSEKSTMQAEPIVYTNPYTNMQETRLRLIFNDYNYADISIDKLMGLIYLISKINLYESAQILINYLQRPDYGYNFVDLSSTGFEEDIPVDYEGGVDVKSTGGRKVQTGKSVFDRIDDM